MNGKRFQINDPKKILKAFQFMSKKEKIIINIIASENTEILLNDLDIMKLRTSLIVNKSGRFHLKVCKV